MPLWFLHQASALTSLTDQPLLGSVGQIHLLLPVGFLFCHGVFHSNKKANLAYPGLSAPWFVTISLCSSHNGSHCF